MVSMGLVKLHLDFTVSLDSLSYTEMTLSMCLLDVQEMAHNSFRVTFHLRYRVSQ
jgi:hypothetical protein